MYKYPFYDNAWLHHDVAVTADSYQLCQCTQHYLTGLNSQTANWTSLLTNKLSGLFFVWGKGQQPYSNGTVEVSTVYSIRPVAVVRRRYGVERCVKEGGWWRNATECSVQLRVLHRRISVRRVLDGYIWKAKEKQELKLKEGWGNCSRCISAGYTVLSLTGENISDLQSMATPL